MEQKYKYSRQVFVSCFRIATSAVALFRLLLPA